MQDVLNLIRILLVGFFAYAAWVDIKTRRVNDLVWVVLSVAGLGIFTADIVMTTDRIAAYRLYLFFLSVIPIGGLGVLFARLGFFGWADAGAFLALSIIFPMILPFEVMNVSFPLFRDSSLLMSYVVLLNAALLSLTSPVVIALRNLYTGSFEFPYGIYLTELELDNLWSEHGSVAYSDDGQWIRSTDLDVIRRYLQWRGCPVDCIFKNPSSHRDYIDLDNTVSGVSSLPITEEPTSSCSTDLINGESNKDSSMQAELVDDKWGIDLFIDEEGVELYGASAGDIRNSLDQVFIDQTPARLSLGQPFLLFVFAGIISTLLFGSILHVVGSLLALI